MKALIHAILLAAGFTLGFTFMENIRRAEREHVVKCYEKYNDDSKNSGYQITLCVEGLEK